MAAKASARITLVHDDALIAQLEGLGTKVYKRVIGKASRKAFSPVLKTAKSLAPRETGLLKKSLGVKQKAYPKSGRIVTVVGPRTGFAEDVTVKTPFGPKKVRRDPVKYAHLVEFGTKPHSVAALANNKIRASKAGAVSDDNRVGFEIAIQSGDTHPGAPPKPFMRPAFDTNVSQAKSIMHRELAAGVIREATSK